jgi:hypothetical protein
MEFNKLLQETMGLGRTRHPTSALERHYIIQTQRHSLLVLLTKNMTVSYTNTSRCYIKLSALYTQKAFIFLMILE